MKKFYFTKKRILVGTPIIAILLLVCVALSPTIVNASSTGASSYESVKVNNGDTLWTLASEYNTSELSTKDFIKEIKDVNGLSSDIINEGNYVLIPIYK